MENIRSLAYSLPDTSFTLTNHLCHYFLLWWYFLWQFAQSTTHFRISNRMIVLLKAQSTNRDTLAFLV